MVSLYEQGRLGYQQ